MKKRSLQDFFISARRDNPRFGFNQWQLDWDGLQDDYEPLDQQALDRYVNVFRFYGKLHGVRVKESMSCSCSPMLRSP